MWWLRVVFFLCVSSMVKGESLRQEMMTKLEQANGLSAASCPPNAYTTYNATYYTASGDVVVYPLITYTAECNIAYVAPVGFNEISMFQFLGVCYVAWTDCTDTMDNLCGIYNGQIVQGGNCQAGTASDAWAVAASFQNSNWVSCSFPAYTPYYSVQGRPLEYRYGTEWYANTYYDCIYGGFQYGDCGASTISIQAASEINRYFIQQCDPRPTP